MDCLGPLSFVGVETKDLRRGARDREPGELGARTAAARTYFAEC